MATFGERLKFLREEKGMSQAELGRAFNLSQSSIAYYELDDKPREPNQSTLQKFADLFNCSVDYLLGRSNIRNTETINTETTQTNIDPDLPEDWQKQLSFIRRAGSKHLTPEEKEDLLELGKMFVRKIERRIKEEQEEEREK